MNKTNNSVAKNSSETAVKISAALKENYTKKLQEMLNEAMNDVIGSDEDEDETETKVDISSDTQDNDTEGYEEEDLTTTVADDDETQTGDESGDDTENDDEWSDLEQHKVGDEEDYDLTTADDDTIFKVFKNMEDNDQVFIKKDEDGNLTITDNETGDEYTVTEPDATEPGNEDTTDNGDEFEISLDTDSDETTDVNGEDGGDIEDQSDDTEDSEGDITIELSDDEEDEDEDDLNENLGYTDNFQKDVFKNKFNMNEPADPKATNDWDAGAPKGNGKRWAGKGNQKPFNEPVNETRSQIKGRLTSKNLEPQNAKEYGAKTQHNVSTAQDGEEAQVNEAMKKIIAKAKQLQEENKKYKAALKEFEEKNKEYAKGIQDIHESLVQAAVLNANYGRILNLMMNESTTREEKKAIFERFEKVTTNKDGQALYETIKRELKESRKSTPVLEHAAAGSTQQNLTETCIYNAENNASLSLMERMENVGGTYHYPAKKK